MREFHRYGVLVILSGFLLFSMNSQVTSSHLAISEQPSAENILASTEDAGSAAAISSIAFNAMRNILRQAYERPITQLEITNHIDTIMRAEGSDGELSCSTMVMTQDEFLWPYGHSNDDAEHIIDPVNEPVVTVRAGARVNGQCVDVYRTFFYESVTQEIIDAYSTVLATETAVIAAIEPGVSVAELSTIVQSGLSSYTALSNISYSYYWGHGVGDFVIVDPILSVEPEPLNLVEDQLLGIQIWLYHDDGWFVRVEDTVAVTSTGVEVLSDAPKQLEDIMIRSSKPHVDATFNALDYEYGNVTTTTATIDDDADRTVSTVDFFDGKNWVSMTKVSPVSFSHSHLLDYSYPSFIRGILRINLSNDTVYIIYELECDLISDHIFEETYSPPVKVVVEQVLDDGPFRYIFSNFDAEMLRVNFYNLHPPPGDQFLVRDSEGNVVFEYKWNLGEGDVSPWVPGNILYIDVISTWKSEYGGVNHFYFTVDMMWVFDTDFSPSTETTTTNSTTSSTSTTTNTTTSGSTDTPLLLDPSWILIGGIFCTSIVAIGIFIRRR
ncbi:MAG: M24 family metallopeptidase [Candidatus Thorarchaeota archaeon]